MKKLRFLAFLLFFLPSVVFPQVRYLENGNRTLTGPDAGLFADTPTRLKIDLAGKWKFTSDGNAWHDVEVPGAYDFVGKTVFQRSFEIPAEYLDRFDFSLVCYGINYASEISVNGNFIGRHGGGYTSFVLRIPENTLQVGRENAIKIIVDNDLTLRTTLPLRQRVGGWRSYGGILRDIYILAVPKVAIDAVECNVVLSADGKSARFRVRSLIERRTEEPPAAAHALTYSFAVYDKLSEALISRSQPVPVLLSTRKTVGVVAEAVVADPKLWSPETPDLYVVRCLLSMPVGQRDSVLDQFDFNYGVRSIQLKGSTILVNGSPTTLHGVLWREDHPVFGAAMSYEAMEKDIVNIKALGATLIRFVHPPHPYMLNLCDRYGLFAMQELPATGVPYEIMQTDNFQELMTTALTEMILRDRHHPSVLAWGLGDESDAVWAGVHDCAFSGSLRVVAANLDNRPLYYATESLKDECLAAMEIVAVNIPAADLRGFRDTLAIWAGAMPSKPLIVARYGRPVEPDNRRGYSDPLSMEAQARYALQCLEIMKKSNVAGSILWSFNDWRGDRPALSTYASDPYLHAMGIVSHDRTKRIAYGVIQSAFRGEKVTALPIGSYSPTAPMIFVVVGLVVLIALAFLYNSTRRFRENVNRSMTRTYNFFADIRDQRGISYGYTIFLAAIVSLAWSTVIASVLAHYRDSLLLDNLLSQLMPDRLKEAFVRMVWVPAEFIFVVALIILLKIVFISLLIKFFSYIVRTRVYFFHTFSITVWSMLPYIVLIPLSMILFRVLETPVYVAPAFVLIGLLVVWSLYRLFKGIAIIFDLIPLKVYFAGSAIIIVVVVFIYAYLDYTQFTSVYFKHLLHIGSVSSAPSNPGL